MDNKKGVHPIVTFQKDLKNEDLQRKVIGILKEMKFKSKIKLHVGVLGEFLPLSILVGIVDSFGFSSRIGMVYIASNDGLSKMTASQIEGVVKTQVGILFVEHWQNLRSKHKSLSVFLKSITEEMEEFKPYL